ncbi:multidrug effflux MFS transporter [Ruegeria sp. 2012CJ41-6]|uniref:Bcr/CflA family efflux transporter n=1 Tax=Ruegeria spongiae TaxID=2942209 RepID=A0ABT0Q6J7_9RHOB|nr:multidrug effflux MFS transporter [Ruegeria spongiae]MCL6285503.1 multidrug effflux MFS transporter [Ruegeria spongiae]
MAETRTPPHLITLVLATAIGVLSVNMFLPSLPNMSVAFGVDYGVINLSVAGYLLVTAVMQLGVGPLSDRFGRRPAMLGAMGIFALASVGCALAESIEVFLACRMVQGTVVAGQVVARAAIRDMYPPNEAASKLGYVTMAMALAPMLGPMLGGVLEMGFGWRASFWLYSGMGFGILLLLWLDFGETNTTQPATFAAQIRQYPELFASRRFWGYSLCAAFSIGGFYAFITGAPLVAAAWFDLSPALLGLGIGIITAGFVVGNFVTGLIAKRTKLIWMIIAGRVVATAGPLLGLILFLAGQGTVWVFFGAAVFVGFGNGLTVANATVGLMSVRPALAGSASGLSGALVVVLGAVLTSATGIMVTPETAPFAVLGMMLGSSALGLLSALYVLRVDLRDPLPDAT